MTAPVTEAMRDALADWRRDGLLLCLLPLFCWPALVAAVLTRPLALVVLLSPVVFGVRELFAARWAGRALREPAARWTSYEAVVVRTGWLPPVLLVDLLDPGDGPDPLDGRRGALTLGLLGRRVLPPGGGDGAVRILLAGDPAAGGVLWAPAARRLGRARPARAQPRSRVSR